jgi:prepilin-type N-terminal cleavage/methylation domain-containing protein
MKILKSQKGFTLLELMVTMSIVVIMSYCLFLALRAGDEQRQAADAKMLIYDSAREGLYKMVQEIRQTAPSRVTIGVGSSDITFSIPNSATPVDATTYSVDWTTAQQVTYAIGGTNNNQVIRTVGGVSTVVAHDVTALTFTGNATPPSVITVRMSVQHSTAGGRTMPANAIQMSGQARLRNA